MPVMTTGSLLRLICLRNSVPVLALAVAVFPEMRKPPAPGSAQQHETGEKKRHDDGQLDLIRSGRIAGIGIKIERESQQGSGEQNECKQRNNRTRETHFEIRNPTVLRQHNNPLFGSTRLGVGKAGLEPARRKAQDPKSCVYTNFTTCPETTRIENTKTETDSRVLLPKRRKHSKVGKTREVPMEIKLNFFGAAQNVTGSCYLAEANGARILVDCGLYQERDLKQRNWDPFPVPPKSIDAVLLTHAHLDHCGRLPRLVKEGFCGKIFGTPATLDIAQIIMKDSAFLQEEDIKHKKARHEKQGKTSPFPYEPLYTQADVDQTIPLLTPVDYKTPVPVGPGLAASFREAGHIFGSTSIRLNVTQDGESRTILFSGDVGRWDMPIINDPDPFPDADYVLIESTYGDRIHGEMKDIPGELARIVNETRKAGGNLVIPSFAVERTQEILYHLGGLLNENRIPHLFTFVDSPMAIRVTEVFKKHPELFDAETRQLLHSGKHLCDLPGLTLSNTSDQSKAINQIKGTAIIIAGSGMCTGGRIKHHLKNNISRPESTILFVGFQALGTLGRLILDGTDPIRIFGEEQPVRARIEKISGFSAHADQNELLRWLSALKKAPRQVFLVHGEPDAAHALKQHISEKTGWACTVPEYKQEITLQ